MANPMEKARIVSRIRDEALSFEDIPAYMTLVCDLCNEDEKIRKQTADDRVTFQFLIEGGKDFWLKVDGGNFSYGNGKLDAPNDVNALRLATEVVRSTLAFARARLAEEDAL